MRTVSQPQLNPRTLIEQVLVSILIGAAIFISAVAAFITGYQMRYAGQIYPGVSVAGIDISGLTVDEAGAKITQEIRYPQNGRLLIQGESQNWFATPAEVGLFLDPGASARKAFEIGRDQSLVQNILTV
jgi:hypothetical protein